MADIFISYAREDLEIVLALAEAFKNYGWSVWWDADLKSGTRFHDIILNELEKAKCVIVLWSQYSEKSDFVRDEAQEGKERDILIPILIGNLKPPLGFRSLHTRSFIGWQKGANESVFLGLVKDICRILGDPSPSKDSKTVYHSDFLAHLQHLLQIDSGLNLDRFVNQSKLFKAAGICSEYNVKSFPDRFFIAQEFNVNSVSLREALERAFKELGMTSIRADDTMSPVNKIICKVILYIWGTPFGVYHLSESQNRNVCVELGIAMGLEKPFVLVKDMNARVPHLLNGIDTYEINSYIETEHELYGLLKDFIADIGRFRYSNLPAQGIRRLGVVACGNDEVDVQFRVIQEFNSHNMEVAILGSYNERLSAMLNQYRIKHSYLGTLTEVVFAIQSATFGVYAVDKFVSPDVFIALGVALGLGRPYFLIRKEKGEIITNLKGVSALKYHGISNLQTQLKIVFPDWIEKAL